MPSLPTPGDWAVEPVMLAGTPCRIGRLGLVLQPCRQQGEWPAALARRRLDEYRGLLARSQARRRARRAWRSWLLLRRDAREARRDGAAGARHRRGPLADRDDRYRRRSAVWPRGSHRRGGGTVGGAATIGAGAWVTPDRRRLRRHRSPRARRTPARAGAGWRHTAVATRGIRRHPLNCGIGQRRRSATDAAAGHGTSGGGQAAAKTVEATTFPDRGRRHHYYGVGNAAGTLACVTTRHPTHPWGCRPPPP
jgi:hypothetical protein